MKSVIDNKRSLTDTEDNGNENEYFREEVPSCRVKCYDTQTGYYTQNTKYKQSSLSESS